MIRRAIFEALAANAGSALTPIGDPQNLYLWQRSATSFVEFTGTMLAICLLCYRRIEMSIDWGLLLVFVLMFVGLRLIADTALVKELITNVNLSQPSHLYLLAIATSQLISNGR